MNDNEIHEPTIEKVVDWLRYNHEVLALCAKHESDCALLIEEVTDRLEEKFKDSRILS